MSFTKAASELNVTHGAVSRQVALLESWLGTQLFRRTPSQLTLTDAGRSYLTDVTASLDRLALASMQLAGKTATASLHVNAPPTFTMHWLIARMSSFQRKRPEVEIRMTTSLAPVNFQENGYDVAIRGASSALPGCVSKPFMTEIIVPVCHVDLLEGGHLAQPSDLSRQTLISYVTEPYPWAEWLGEAGVPDLSPVATLKFEQMYFALQAAQEGLGVALVPLFLAIDDIVAGRLCTPFGSLAARQRRYFANAQQPSPLVEAFIDWLTREGRDTEKSMVHWASGEGWDIALLPGA